jgi:WD40 repeat protein
MLMRLAVWHSASETVGIWEIGAGAPHGFTGHGGNVQDMAFSPDGQLLASAGGYDHTVRLWNVKSGTVMWPFNEDGYARGLILTGHIGMVTRVAFSPNGSQLASAGANIERAHIPGIPGRTRPVERPGRTDRTVRLWNVSTGSPELTLEGHTEGVQDVAFSPNGRLLASAALDRTVRFWDVDTGETVHKLTSHISGIPRIAFSPDGHLLAAAGTGAQPIHLVTDFWQ